jgi:hypothetical protein
VPQFANHEKKMSLSATNSTQNRAKMLYLKQAEIRRSDEWQKAFQARKFETIFLLEAHLPGNYISVMAMPKFKHH